MPKYVQAHLTCMLKIFDYEYIYIYMGARRYYLCIFREDSKQQQQERTKCLKIVPDGHKHVQI